MHPRTVSWLSRIVVVVSVGICGISTSAFAAQSAPDVSIVSAENAGAASRHGLAKLEAALRAQGWSVERATSLETAHGRRVVLASLSAVNEAVKRGVEPAGLLDHPESLAIQRFSSSGKPALLLAGGDDRGLMYAELDVADRIGWAKRAGESGADPFSEVRDTQETPATRDRSVSVYTMNRAYWESRFYDEAYWTRYFDMLAADRFNKFLVIFGYENGGFLAPCYPYFFDTPGFSGVHMVDLTPEQQRKNLAALNRMIELAHERGIAFAVGIWDHIYRAGVQTGGVEWIADYKGRPVPNTVEGVTTENLNAYTLASLTTFFEAFPGLDEVQFRIHEESGLKREEMDEFWREVFTRAKRVRPDLLFEARGKGTPDSVIDTALSLGVKLRVETKFWMEQMGLPFHPTHVNPQNQRDRRHGYADFLRYPKRYDMNWRLWTGGTSRVLLWGDPEYVRRYVGAAQLYESPNWDVNEPLATKMEAQRPDMKPFDLMPAKYRYYDYEFERYWHFFQVWGRVGYNPGTPPEAWEHEFVRHFGAAAAPHVEAGLHRASWVLPYIVASSVYPYSGFPTTRGWAERQSLGASLEDYAKNTGTDVQQFESFEDAAKRIASGGAITTTKRTPYDVSRWFDETADAILAEVDAAEKAIGDKRGNEFDSTMTDLRILANLARFHARRAIAAVDYDLYKIGKSRPLLESAVNGERKAIDAWRTMVDAAGDRYASDLAMGARNFSLCGHWRDELAALGKDLAQLEEQLHAVKQIEISATQKEAGIADPRPSIDADRILSARPLAPLRVTARVSHPSGVKSVRLRYRHLTQFEDYATLDMQPTSEPGVFAATIPGEFIVPEWDLMYFIEATDNGGHGTQWPDLDKETPYIVVHLER